MIESETIIDMEKTGNNLRKYVYENGYSVKDIQQYLCELPKKSTLNE